jgi:hypothetical protein
MFRHGHVNTTNLVERMWHYVKYMLLDGKVNHRLDELILAIIGNPETRRRFGRNTLVEQYSDAHFLSMSGNIRREGGKRPHGEIAKSTVVGSTIQIRSSIKSGNHRCLSS